MGLAEQLRWDNATGVCEEKWRSFEFIVLHEHMSQTSGGSRFIDGLMDSLVVPGYSRIGYALRARAWGRPSALPLAGHRVVLTGHTSGIGFAAAQQLRQLGADLLLVGRDAQRTADASARVRSLDAPGIVEDFVADMGEPTQVRDLAMTLLNEDKRVDVLIHNAGALLKTRTRNSLGVDTTLAVHLYGPHLLTTLLLPRLRESSGRVITVASGGMYAVGLPDFAKGHGLELPDGIYDGTKQYAIAKRAQVTLNEMWAHRADADAVSFHAMHPGWVDTPGVANSIPVFRAITRPILRSAPQGADTITWLASAETSEVGTGGFWCDRARRPIHRLPATRRSDTPAARAEVWSRVESTALGSFS